MWRIEVVAYPSAGKEAVREEGGSVEGAGYETRRERESQQGGMSRGREIFGNRPLVRLD